MSRISSKSPVTSPLSHKNPVQQYAPWLYAFWKFSRPHTIIGTSLSVLGIYLITAGHQPVGADAIDFKFWFVDLRLPAGAIATLLRSPASFLLPLLACLSGNVYIVGLNQLEDVAIDRINKPHLPLASGEFSRRQAATLVTITGLLALLLASLQGWFLFATVGISLIIGTAYSLPPIRLKRFPFWASLCILTVRGAIVNLGLFLHFNQGFPIPPHVWALTLFVIVFTFAIAIFKDIPDLDGDRHYNITTFTIQLGQRTVFNLARWVLTGCYLGMVVAGLLLLPEMNTPVLVISHLALMSGFLIRSRYVNLQDKTAIASCYQFIWRLFFLEYLVFPLAYLLR